jgi:hypothetical protein
VDELLPLVFDDLAAVAQGVAALWQPPGENEVIQRLSAPAGEVGFVARAAGAGGKQQGEGDCERLVRFHRRLRRGKAA